MERRKEGRGSGAATEAARRWRRRRRRWKRRREEGGGGEANFEKLIRPMSQLAYDEDRVTVSATAHSFCPISTLLPVMRSATSSRSACHRMSSYSCGSMNDRKLMHMAIITRARSGGHLR